MKKLLTALTLLAGLLLSAPAHATVSCSVPFNLTNGTVADASQVMANYNAILTCLSTSAASSGTNSDITSLNALSTPITPAQGGAQALCGATGFKAVNDTGTPNTELDISYTQALVTNGTNQVQFGTSGSLVLNFGTTGANGLDTGSLTASTGYFLYLIGNGSVIASLASLSSTAPLLPSGYTYSCRIGAWYANTASHLVTAQIAGHTFFLTQKSGGGGSNLVAASLQYTGAPVGSCGNFSIDTLVLTTFTGLPTTAIHAIGVLNGEGTGQAAVSSWGPSVSYTAEILVNNTGPNIMFDIVIPAPQQIWICSSGSSEVISILGWVDSVNAN